ncbi:MAG: AI-2E family transporter [Polyangiaceae bacterium]|nr:AI-2E family transporter [Polyangiaceae bacterium]
MAHGAKEPGTSFRRKMVFLAVLGAIGLGYVLRGVLIPLFLGFLLAYALDPFVERLEALRIPRSLSAVLVMLGINGLFVMVIVFSIPVFVDEMTDAARSLPAQFVRLQENIEQSGVLSTLHINLPHTFSELSKTVTERVGSASVFESGRTFLFGTIGYVGVALSALIVPVFALYLLIDFDRIVARVEELIPRRFTRPIADVAAQIHITLSGYVRGQLTANMVLAALYGAGLRIVDIRLAVPIGVMTGMLAFVPYVGFSIGLLVATSMAILDWQGLGTLMGVFVVMGSVQIIDAMVITPRIVGRSVGLAPLEVIITMMAAGSLFGFLGVLLAVPLGAVAKILTQRAVSAYLASDYYLQPAHAALTSNEPPTSQLTTTAPPNVPVRSPAKGRT